eukprot:315657_1
MEVLPVLGHLLNRLFNSNTDALSQMRDLEAAGVRPNEETRVDPEAINALHSVNIKISEFSTATAHVFNARIPALTNLSPDALQLATAISNRVKLINDLLLGFRGEMFEYNPMFRTAIYDALPTNWGVARPQSERSFGGRR